MSYGVHRILVIDDNRAIHDDLKKILLQDTQSHTEFRNAESILFDEGPDTAQFNTKFTIDSAFQGAEGLDMVKKSIEEKNPYALAFVDVRMPPGWDGLETVTRIWKIYPQLQIVICTAYSDYSWRDMVNILGCSENLMVLKKPFDSIEALQLAHGLTKKWSLARQVQEQLENLDRLVQERTQDLLASEERFSKAFKSSPIAMAIQAVQPEQLIDINPSFIRLTGYDQTKTVGRSLRNLNLWSDPMVHLAIQRVVDDNEPLREFRCELQSSDGQTRQVSLFGEMFNLGDKPHLLLLVEDVTERISLEGQLRQAHKREAVGQVVAGVAHDFNNILTIVQGNISHVLENEEFRPEVHNALQQVLGASERASLLVGQLLAFTRKQVVQLKPLDLGDLLERYIQILHRLIGEQIIIETHMGTDLPQIMADDCSIEQVIMNLAVNARDSMPDGGTLRFDVEEVEVTEPPHQDGTEEVQGGKFVRLQVSDTGTGMEDTVLKHLFEPFFTTKDVGKGTGMGLATAYGIVRQHKGWIDVESTVGRGSTFTIHFPVSDVQIKETKPDKAPTPEIMLSKASSEIILVVEDEPFLREFVQNVLEHYGFNTVLASDANEALRKWENYQGEIDLVLTDIVMPGGMNGRQLINRLSRQCPELKAIYTSGYSPEVLGPELADDSERAFLQKPYHAKNLIQTIRTCLDN